MEGSFVHSSFLGTILGDWICYLIKISRTRYVRVPYDASIPCDDSRDSFARRRSTITQGRVRFG